MLTWHLKRLRKLVIALFLPACVAFWFVTAPAGRAIARIVSDGNGGPIVRLVCGATDWYESPMVYRNYESYDVYERNRCTGWRCITCDSNGAGADGQQRSGAHVQRTAARDLG